MHNLERQNMKLEGLCKMQMAVIRELSNQLNTLRKEGSYEKGKNYPDIYHVGTACGKYTNNLR